ncbi:hypothetical protein Pint_36533 [Pistacia integerrima]|uniref:Uncharacterized protein n=1 Tax=Pistacia integerrima TaxID=434235 RepID=A0ACC0Y196_9ROSI|nr:hypothetical protein Pint_36533 [Pistacia integerrima]
MQFTRSVSHSNSILNSICALKPLVPKSGWGVVAPIEESVIMELEQMEKDCDIDDILSYRSAAECELQEALMNSSNSSMGMDGGTSSIEKSRNDEHSSSRSRGWLNWLSRGMLGAGGTDDYSQFSGVVSDEVVKDIYEATKFHPLVLPSVDEDGNDKFHTCAIWFSIARISVSLWSRDSGQKIAKLVLEGAVIDCNIWEELANVAAVVKSAKMVYPLNKKVILLMGEVYRLKIYCLSQSCKEKALQSEQSSLSVQVDLSSKEDVELSVKVRLQPLEATCDTEFLLNFVEFFSVLKSFKSLHERVLSSLNGIKDVKARLSSKAGYILSSHKNVIWDVNITGVTINLPWRNVIAEESNLLSDTKYSTVVQLIWILVLQLGSLLIKSKSDLDSLTLNIEEQSSSLKLLLNACSEDFTMGFLLQDLYNHFEVKLNDFEIKLGLPHYPQKVPILEKFCASIALACSIIPDESILNQLEVNIVVSLLRGHLSPSIYESIVSLILHLDILQSRTGPARLKHSSSPNITLDQIETSVFGFSISASLESVSLYVDLANDGENSSLLMLALQKLDFCYSLKELENCWISMKALKIISYPLRGKDDSHILASCEDAFASSSSNQQNGTSDLSDQSDNNVNKSSSSEVCFSLHYEAGKCVNNTYNKCTVCLNDADLHCYPYIFGLLMGFFDKISSYSASGTSENSSIPTVDGKSTKTVPHFGFQKFGFSNFFETGSSDHANISLDNYPFITICNSGYLGSLENSLLYPIPDWRKIFNLRDRTFKSLRCNLKKGSEMLNASSWKSSSDMITFPGSGSFDDTNQFLIDINLCEIRVHFHDSSCTVGTVTVPSSKSAILIYENCVDLLSSNVGLVLTSSWCTKNFHKCLWGPSSPNLSPILNLRVRKGNIGSLSTQVEVSLAVQHVCCVLPPEYLAILIGYFSLPDWNLSEQTVAEQSNDMLYKFEILDSDLIVPVENDDHQFLKVEIQQLYCSFIHNCSLNNILMDISPEYMVPAHKLAKHNHCLNIFGRDLFLSFLPFKDDGYGCLMVDQDTGYGNNILIGPLSADAWVRIPWESESTCGSSSAPICVMSRLYHCQIIANDCYTFDGFEALLDVIDKFSSVDVESKMFTSDVLHFLQLKKCLMEKDVVSPVTSDMIFTEVKCCVDSLSIKLLHLRKDSVLLKPFAKVDMQFICSVSLMNETPISLDLNCFSLALYSSVSSALLARCNSDCSAPSALGICLSKSEYGENRLHVSLPSLDIWLHFSDWTEVIDFYDSLSQKMSKTANTDVPTKNSGIDTEGQIENLVITVSQSAFPSSCMSTDHVSKNIKDAAVFIVKSENIGITVHFPIRLNEAAFQEDDVAEIQDECPQKDSLNMAVGKHSKYVAITTHSRCSELLIYGGNAKLKILLEKTSGVVGTCEEKSVNSWPFFQILQVNVETEFCRDQLDLVHVNVYVQCDRLDLLLSYQVLYFWHDVVFDTPKAGSSQLAFPSMDLEIRLRKVSLLISDGRWSCSGHLLEITIRNFLLHSCVTESSMESSVATELQVNYSNIRKVSWEPFIEPWKFEMKVIRKHEMIALLNSSIITDIDLTATAQLNLNFTDSLVECIFRTVEMVKDAWGLMGPENHPENQIFLNSLMSENISEGRYAPYGPLFPIYLNETPDEQLFHYRNAYSSDRLSDKQSDAVTHHFMTIQLDGTSVPSGPISMDLVGMTYFEVILSNATSIPLELRFDIPFGLAPKLFCYFRSWTQYILAKEFPLPLHLAEAGRMRWRPLGKSYLWSEAHTVSTIISQESKIGYPRSFVCYPSHPSSDPFRCCISVQNVILPSSSGSKRSSALHVNSTLKQSVDSGGQVVHEFDRSKNRSIHLVTLSTPFLVNNYLPEAASLTIETGGITRTALLSEVQTPFHDIDPSHDLGLEFNLRGFRPSVFKFPRAETFSTMAKFSGTKFSLSETMTLDPELSSDPTYVILEKTMDAFSGFRELFIFVPFLLYNCTGFPLVVSHSAVEKKGSGSTIPCCYNLFDQEPLQGKKDGLSLISSDQDTDPRAPLMDSQGSSLLKKHIVSTRKINPHFGKFLSKPVISSGSSELLYNHQLNLRESDFTDNGDGKNMPTNSWSTPFHLVPPSGSTSVVVPQTSSNAAFIISVTASSLAGPFAGRTRAITFQPRYVISNACSKALCYKQKGTDLVFHLGVGQHSHLHWTDMTRELLVSVRFNEPGWQWSGSFLPDHLGDTQLKLWNYVSGALNMIRVEVQNPDVSIRDEKIIGSPDGNSGTNLILLSDDDTGYMPYRIDNFSKERLRVYQQRCETFDTIIHPYTSCPYAWDEPCYPHRLTIEVPGERVVGSYILDDLKDHIPVHLPATAEVHLFTLYSICLSAVMAVWNI